ncbi:MAG TPA: protein translocase subunit SecF [Acidimicrobiales bacterium]|nr:protein translocase subunit SecF [Acidimicrobiales bacterium]
MTTEAPAEPVVRRRNIFKRLYYGETASDFVGHRRWWFTGSGLIILIGAVFLVVSGLNLSIDFRGGTSWEVPATNGLTVATARSAAQSAGLGSDATVEQFRQGNKTTIEVQAYVKGNNGATNPKLESAVTDALAKAAKQPTSAVSINDVGPSWGSDITNKAILALVLFVFAIIIYLSIRFEPKMALAAIVAVFHDILITVGIYAVFQFAVSPDTVIAFLTILGYSLYDTVVVFDKVQENTRGLASTGRYTYSDTVNIAMNQVLMRSINTSLVAIMPIVSVLVIGAYVLGARSLQDFGLALFIGLLSGAYSSIFIASPLLAILKEREPRYANIRQRLASRGAVSAILTPQAAAQSGGGLPGGTSARSGGDGVITPRGTGDGRAPEARPGGLRPAANRPGARRPPPRPRKKGRRR